MFDLPTDRAAVMGILNVTPDSFSDGGRYFNVDAAVAHGVEMWEQGADLIDVGGESTRPGAEAVSASEELKRVVPVIRALRREGIPVSIDSYKPEVAREAVAAGASVVNDVTGLRDPEMIDVLRDNDASVCIMHMQGNPQTMQERPRYRNVVVDVREYLVHAAMLAEDKGVARDRVWIDPGIGFGKTLSHNLTLLAHLDEFVRTGYPVLVGVSRKSFIGKVLGTESEPVPVEHRREGTLAVESYAITQGVRIVRSHDVAASVRAADMLAAIARNA
ncbi:MAG TPA: dihydropteroate synthase [Fimbriimonadaceae bacterium]|nr:dihydropteroate synthase [Fimbriimonadaceae bacterium]